VHCASLIRPQLIATCLYADLFFNHSLEHIRHPAKLNVAEAVLAERP
jgi:hypothetical protein